MDGQTKVCRRGDFKVTVCLSIFITIPFDHCCFSVVSFPEDTPAVGEGQHCSLRRATSSPHALSWSIPKRHQMGMEPNRGATCTELWVVLTDSIQPWFATLLCFFPPCLSVKKDISCHMQVMTNYYGTCNPETFDMTCTSYSKMNVWRIPQDDLTPALQLMW